MLCGAEDFVASAEFGRDKRAWLSRFRDSSRGILSYERFNAIPAAIKPAEFEKRLLSIVVSGAVGHRTRTLRWIAREVDRETTRLLAKLEPIDVFGDRVATNASHRRARRHRQSAQAFDVRRSRTYID